MRKKILIILGVSVFILPVFILPAYSKLVIFNKKSKLFQNLEKQIKKELRSVRGDVSYLIQDLAFPRLKLCRREYEEFPAASLIKLPILAVSLQAVQDNRISLSSVILITRRDITGGSGVLKSKGLPLKITFCDLLECMIADSDNTATNKVIDLLGREYINKSFKRFGLKRSFLKRKMMDFSGRRRGIENYTCVSDIAMLLEKIYGNKLIDSQSSQLALSFLRKQKINDRIPRYLPEEADVAHKTGLERGVVHDAGIVFAPKGDYIICVLTKKVKDYQQAKKFIAKITLLTYNFYQ